MSVGLLVAPVPRHVTPRDPGDQHLEADAEGGEQQHADESLVVIRFANPHGIDFPYLLSMLHDSWMSRANTLVVPGGKMELALQLIFTPLILRLVERRRKALAA